LDPVVVVERGGKVKAYPVQILMWHEMVNDEIAGERVVVTYCPLCNAAAVWSGEHEGEELEFGTAGLLRHSNLVMYDRQTESLWQQFTGEGLVGEHAGQELARIPAEVMSFAHLRDHYPTARVLSRDTGYNRAYGTNPYPRYDPAEASATGVLEDKTRVVGILLGGRGGGERPVAVTWSAVRQAGALEVEEAGKRAVIFHQEGMSTPLETGHTHSGREVGVTTVFSPAVAGEYLGPFQRTERGFEDAATRSIWDITGTAVEGPRRGERLERIIHYDTFWFAWKAFYPQAGEPRR
jgi:hypothetical protein